jgi:mannose-6-phosphate isomerase-like protein (cupin superfamily)
MEEVIDLFAAGGTGPVWGTASEDLNATLLAWPAGQEIAEHVNEDRDVLIVVVDGEAEVWVDGRRHVVRGGTALLVGQGTTRRIHAGPQGVRYLSVHRRRGLLQIEPLARASSPPADPAFERSAGDSDAVHRRQVAGGGEPARPGVAGPEDVS